MGPTHKDRFWAKVRKTDTCWLWTASKTRNGYGRLWYEGGMILAHRMSWEFAVGSIPKDIRVLHKCDVRACVNPGHLFLGTDADNTADRDKKGRIGNREGEYNGNAKLTPAQVIEIRSRQGQSQRVIAKEFGVSQAQIGNVRSKELDSYTGGGVTTAHAPAARNGIPPLYAHQQKTVELLEREPRVFDTSDPGTGKTRAAYTGWQKRSRKALLVLAPKTLLASAWAADLERFFPGVSYSIARAENREEAFTKKVDIYITNIDAVTWLAKQPKKFYARFDSLAVDEMTAYKHRTSQRSKALAKIRGYFKYREGLTGTPNSLSVTDLWHQIYILDDGQRLGKKFFQFRGAVCQPEQAGPLPNHIRWVDKPYAEEAVAQMIADITIRHQFEDCMDIPPNSSQTIPYELTPKHMRAYEELEKNAILRLEEETVSAVNAAVLRNKLLQIASGAGYHTEGEWALLDTGRYELIMDLVEARKHSVVFFNWSHQKVELLKEAEKRGIKHALIDGTTPDRRRTEIVEDYQRGFYQTLFLHPKTGAHGLTLTKGTTTIWASPIYEADFLKQGKHRIYRAGQTERTETLLIEAAGTVEKKVYERLNEKTARMVNLLSLLKETSE